MALNDTKKSANQSIQATPELFIGLVVVAILLVGVVFYMNVYSEKTAQIEAMNANIQSLQTEVADLEVQQSQIIEINREKEQLTKRLAVLRAKIPSTEDELNYFLESVNQRARSSRIAKWILFKQDDPVAHDDYSALPIRMEFEASYEAMLQFFWDLASMGDGTAENSREQIINIKEVEIQKSTQNNKEDVATTLLKVNCVAETYLYTGKSAASAEQR